MYKTRIPIYDINLYIHIGRLSEQLQKKLDIVILEDNIAEVHDLDNGILVWFESNEFNAPIVCHEAIHIKNILFEYIGYKLDTNNDEAEAYLTEYIVKEIEKCYKKHKK